MEYRDLVKTTVLDMDQDIFLMLQKALVGEYLSFSIIDAEEITKEILAEKLCDYFEKLELKTGKAFEKHLDAYIGNIEIIVGGKVAKAPQPKKKDATPVVVPRARKYYEKAMNVKNTRSITVRQLKDYTRIMMCLYAAIIKNNNKEIDNLDYSASCIDPDAIITSMKNEQDMLLKLKKPKFDIKELYCSDTCTFIIAIIALYAIVGEKVQGEYYHE